MILSSQSTGNSGIICSITPSSYKSSAVIFIFSAASCDFFLSFHNIEANPSGDSTEYTEFSIIHTSSVNASAKAPPLPPSPVIIESIGVFTVDNSYRLSAIALPCPRSSAPIPQYAPGVSTKHITGRWNFSACLINLNAFLYPSGFAIPKFLLIFSFVVVPF